MQKPPLEEYKMKIKYPPLLKWKYIAIIGLLTTGVFGFDLYKLHISHKYSISTAIKQALITATANYKFLHLENSTLIASNSASSYFSSKQQGGLLNKSPFIQMTDASALDTSATNVSGNNISATDTLATQASANSMPVTDTASTQSTTNNNPTAADNNLSDSLAGELPNTLPNKSLPNTSINPTEEFPADLPHSANNIQEQTDHFNTPEYVIIRSSDQATFSSETTAHIALLTIEEGSYFKKGDILLQLDCREQQAELKKAQAQQLASNEAEKSASKLQGYGSISETE
ncbi:MAG: biotin/lipoyl-binding protein, partial [Gammaproteobacteria bacterium]|nr:biotin/lipoyl-binding protein [Gammaproteobacteria bacterium]